MTAIDWDTGQHTDVVCPPAQDALCRWCGEQLADHINAEEPDEAMTPDGAVCLDSAALLRRVVRYLKFELADGESLDCHETDVCHCGVTLCADHSSSFTTCAGSAAVLHHWSCAHTCADCSDAARDDARSGA